MRFVVGCRLQYEVTSETTLILNIEAQRGTGQRLIGEALAFANECAALSCRALDGRSAIPRLEEVAP